MNEQAKSSVALTRLRQWLRHKVETDTTPITIGEMKRQIQEFIKVNLELPETLSCGCCTLVSVEPEITEHRFFLSVDIETLEDTNPRKAMVMSAPETLQ